MNILRNSVDMIGTRLGAMVAGGAASHGISSAEADAIAIAITVGFGLAFDAIMRRVSRWLGLRP